LSELLVQASGEPVQAQVPAVWVLFELFGFLLKSSLVVRCWLSALAPHHAFRGIVSFYC